MVVVVMMMMMFALAAGKARTSRALGSPVLRTEGRVTLIDGMLLTGEQRVVQVKLPAWGSCREISFAT